MSDTRTIQLNVNGGELTPEVHGRKDLAKRQNGAKLLDNMFVLSYGGASNRGGLRFAAEVKNSDVDVSLERFEIAGDEALAVEVGPGYFRYFFEGGLLLDGGTPIETVTPYTEDQVDTLNFAQSNDEATIVDGGSPIHDLVRTSATEFEITEASFQPSSIPPTDLVAITTEGYTTVPPGGAKKLYEYAISTISSLTGEESLLSIPILAASSDEVVNAPPDIPFLPNPASRTGEIILGFDANYIDITWTEAVDAAEYSIYKREYDTDFWGFVGRSTNGEWRDNGVAPSLADGPQTGQNPFDSVDNYPSIAAFVQQRRVFGATNSRPQTINMTQSANFKNFNTSTPSREDDAVEFTLASQRKQDINHIVSLEKGMIVFTRTGEWRVTGRDGGPITPSSILAEPQSYWGSSEKLDPLIIGEKLIFATQGMQVRDLEYSVTIDRYRSTDLSLLSEHLFRGRKIVSWDYCREPYGLLYCVMDDGEAIVCTFLTEHEVWGWSRMRTAGKFKRVKSIPEAGEDVPYFIVERRVNGEIKKYIEYLKDREFTDIRDAFFVDSGLSYDVPLKISSISYGAETNLLINSHGLLAGDEIELCNVNIEDKFYSITDNLDGRYLVESVVSVDEVRIINKLDDTAVNTSMFVGSFYSGDGVARKAISIVSGLDHLEGMEVSCLCDGGVVENKTVSNGSIDFGRKFARVHVGIGYTSKLQTLDAINPQQNDDGIKKAAATSYVRVYKSRGVYWGLDFEEMFPVESRSFEDYGEPNELINGLVEINFWDGYDLEVTFCAKQENPLPFTFLEIVQEMDYGE